MYLFARLQQDFQNINVTIRWANHSFRTFVEYHYNGDNFFGKIMLEVFAPSFLCVWDKIPKRILKTIVVPWCLLLVLHWWFDK